MEAVPWSRILPRTRRQRILVLATIAIMFMTTSKLLMSTTRDVQFQNNDFISSYLIRRESEVDNLTEGILYKIFSPSAIKTKMDAMEQGLIWLRSAPPRPPQVKHRNLSFIERNFFSSMVQKHICDQYEVEGKMNRTTITKIWHKFNKYAPDDVTMTVHLSVAKMDTLDLLLSHWHGPVSIAVDIKLLETDVFLSKLRTNFKHWASRDNIDFHFVRNDGKFYSPNYLRQVALNNVETRYVFLNDVDFIPQSKLYDELRNHRELVNRAKNVYVVAAFEYLTIPDSMPNTKSKLLQEWDRGNIQPFHYRPNDAIYGHRATDYKKWVYATDSYEATWEMYYEPYIFGEASQLPDYDVRFLGRYFDKISFLDTLAATGFNFTVLPDVFIIHYLHPVHLDVTYTECAEDLYHDTHLAKIRRLWLLARGVEPPEDLYTRAKPPRRKG